MKDHDDLEDWDDLDFTNLNTATAKQSSLLTRTEKLADAQAANNKQKLAIDSSMSHQTSMLPLSATKTLKTPNTLLDPQAVATGDSMSHSYRPTSSHMEVRGTREPLDRNSSNPRLFSRTSVIDEKKNENVMSCQTKLDHNMPRDHNVSFSRKLKSLSAWQESQAMVDQDLSGLELTTALQLPSRTKGQQCGFVFDSDGEDWGEGSLGIRHAGGSRSHSHRASTGSSNLSLSLSSLVESDDGLDGLELPAELESLKQRLQQNNERRAAGDTIKLTTKSSKSTADDTLDGLVFETSNFTRIPVLKNPNIKLASPSSRFRIQDKSLHKSLIPLTPSRNVASNFVNDTRLQKGVPKDAPQREFKKSLEYDSCSGLPKLHSQPQRSAIPSLHADPASIQKEWSTRASQAKITSRQTRIASTRPVFLPGSGPNISSHHVTALNTRLEKFDQHSAAKYSQEDLLQNGRRRATASEALRIQASRYSTRTHVRAKTYGEGHELDLVDDIPTDAVKNRQEISQRSPHVSKNNPAENSAFRLRQVRDAQTSTCDAHPKRPHMKTFMQPSTTPASHNRLGRSQVTPNPRKKRVPRPPALISGINTTPRHRFEKSMAYNPNTFTWEGNENEEMHRFDSVINSPPRPALIANVNGSKKGIQVVNGMVYDPQQMRWFKVKNDEDDNIDPFEDLDDFKIPERGSLTHTTPTKAIGSMQPDQFTVGEEFDVGPLFVKKQRSTETSWKHTSTMWLRHCNDNKYRESLREIYDLLLDE